MTMSSKQTKWYKNLVSIYGAYFNKSRKRRIGILCAIIWHISIFYWNFKPSKFLGHLGQYL